MTEEELKAWRRAADKFLKTGLNGDEIAKALMKAADRIGWIKFHCDEDLAEMTLQRDEAIRGRDRWEKRYSDEKGYFNAAEKKFFALENERDAAIEKAENVGAMYRSVCNENARMAAIIRAASSPPSS